MAKKHPFHAVAMTVVRAIRRGKEACRGSLWKALHQCEGQVVSSIQLVNYKSRGKKKKKAKKKEAKN